MNNNAQDPSWMGLSGMPDVQPMPAPHQFSPGPPPPMTMQMPPVSYAPPPQSVAYAPPPQAVSYAPPPQSYPWPSYSPMQAYAPPAPVSAPSGPYYYSNYGAQDWNGANQAAYNQQLYRQYQLLQQQNQYLQNQVTRAPTLMGQGRPPQPMEQLVKHQCPSASSLASFSHSPCPKSEKPAVHSQSVGTSTEEPKEPQNSVASHEPANAKRTQGLDSEQAVHLGEANSKKLRMDEEKPWMSFMARPYMSCIVNGTTGKVTSGYCGLCKCTVIGSEISFEAHLLGKNHKRLLREKAINESIRHTNQAFARDQSNALDDGSPELMTEKSTNTSPSSAKIISVPKTAPAANSSSIPEKASLGQGPSPIFRNGKPIGSTESRPRPIETAQVASASPSRKLSTSQAGKKLGVETSAGAAPKRATANREPGKNPRGRPPKHARTGRRVPKEPAPSKVTTTRSHTSKDPVEDQEVPDESPEEPSDEPVVMEREEEIPTKNAQKDFPPRQRSTRAAYVDLPVDDSTKSSDKRPSSSSSGRESVVVESPAVDPPKPKRSHRKSPVKPKKPSRDRSGTRKEAPLTYIIQRQDCLAYREKIQTENDRRGFSQEDVDVTLCVDCFTNKRKHHLQKINGEVEEEDEKEWREECRFRGADVRSVKYESTERSEVDMVLLTELDTHKSVRDLRRKTLSLWFPERLRLLLNKEHNGGISLRAADHRKADISRQDADYILEYIAPVLKGLLERDEEMLDKYEGENVALKSIPKGMLENCDVCCTSIFSAHFVCNHCAFTVCQACSNARESLMDKQERSLEEERMLWIKPDDFGKVPFVIPRDGLNWLACPSESSFPGPESQPGSARENTIYEAGFSHQLVPARLIPTEAVKLLLEGIKQLEVIPKPDGPQSEPEELSEEDCEFFCGGKVLWLPAHDTDRGSGVFRRHWAKEMPVVVSGLTDLPGGKESIWNPEYFAAEFGSDEVSLIDCAMHPQMTLEGLKQEVFWEGFANLDGRTLGETGETRLLKIQNWPSDADLSNTLPQHYEELIKSLPFTSYCSTRGALNIMSYLPDHFNPPDLGPELTMAYGMVGNSELATNNLRVNNCDSLYLLVQRSKPMGVNAAQMIREAKSALAVLELDDVSRLRLRQGEAPGAIWNIYRPEDKPKVDEFLKTHGRDHNNKNPLYTEEEFLDGDMRELLLKQANVETLTVVQFEGDAVFVPAGSPYQVWNLHSCIQAGLKFVSPEHVKRCLALTEELRHVVIDPETKNDRFQVKNTLYHAVKAILPVVLSGVATKE